jgi:hypothetical protein
MDRWIYVEGNKMLSQPRQQDMYHGAVQGMVAAARAAGAVPVVPSSTSSPATPALTPRARGCGKGSGAWRLLGI